MILTQQSHCCRMESLSLFTAWHPLLLEKGENSTTGWIRSLQHYQVTLEQQRLHVDPASTMAPCTVSGTGVLGRAKLTLVQMLPRQGICILVAVSWLGPHRVIKDSATQSCSVALSLAVLKML